MSFDQAFSLVLQTFNTEILPPAIQIMIALSPVVLALLLLVIFKDLWVDYVRAKNFISIKYTLIEIKLPKDTFKSPLAMEVFFTALHNHADGTAYNQYWKGETRPWYSMELVSIEGQVKFIMWMEDRRKAGLISALYSQYPDIEIKEIEDYARSVHFDPKTMKIFACEFELAKPDPYPIKTYVDYGLDKDPKEEFKVDPMLPLIEFLGSVGPNQQIWVQILIIAHKKEQRKPGHIFAKTDKWKDDAARLINDEIMLRDAKSKASKKKDPEQSFADIPRLTKGEQDMVAALERSVSKFAFDVGIRIGYIAKKDAFNTPFGVGGIMSNMKQFGAEGFNAFKPRAVWTNQFDYPWQDFRDMRRNRQSRLFLMAYKRRSYFYTPFPSKRMVLNVEELATIYHLPGSVAQTPTLERLPSKKAQAPSNLPI